MDLDGHRRTSATTDYLLDWWTRTERCSADAEGLTHRCQGKPLFVSDELPHYGTVLGELFHQLAPLPPTGKPGRPRNPKRVIDADLDYATVHKTRQGAQIIKVECKVIHGTEQQVFARLAESPSQTINTAYIERSNLDWRLWDAHLTRKAPTVARSMRWLKAKFAICVACYNLIRPHETLSVAAKIGYSGLKPRPWRQMWRIIGGHSLSCWPTRRCVNDMGTSPVNVVLLFPLRV